MTDFHGLSDEMYRLVSMGWAEPQAQELARIGRNHCPPSDLLSVVCLCYDLHRTEEMEATAAELERLVRCGKTCYGELSDHLPGLVPRVAIQSIPLPVLVDALIALTYKGGLRTESACVGLREIVMGGAEDRVYATWLSKMPPDVAQRFREASDRCNTVTVDRLIADIAERTRHCAALSADIERLHVANAALENEVNALKRGDGSHLAKALAERDASQSVVKHLQGAMAEKRDEVRQIRAKLEAATAATQALHSRDARLRHLALTGVQRSAYTLAALLSLGMGWHYGGAHVARGVRALAAWQAAHVAPEVGLALGLLSSVLLTLLVVGAVTLRQRPKVVTSKTYTATFSEPIIIGKKSGGHQ